MTQEELQSVVSATLTHLRNNAKTIDQLEAATTILDSDCMEISGGRKVTIATLAQKFGSGGSNTTGGLDEGSLATYLSIHRYATQDWVTGKNYVTNTSLAETLKEYLSKELAASTYVKKAGDEMTGRLTVPSLKIGDAILTWDSEHEGVKISKGFYSEKYLSSKDVAPDLIGDGSGTASGGLDLEQLENYLTENEYVTSQGLLDLLRDNEYLATKTYVQTYVAEEIGKINVGGETYQELEWNSDDNSLEISGGNSVYIEYANAAGSADTAITAQKADRLTNNIMLWGNTFNGTSDVNGGLTPGADSTYNLGSSARQWANVYTEILTASQSVKIGGGTIAWENSHGGYFSFSGGIFSNKFITAKGISPDIANETGVVKLWGQSYNGLDDVKGRLNYVSGIGLNEDGDIDHSGVFITSTEMRLQDPENTFTIIGYNTGVIMDFSPAYASVGIGGYALEDYRLNVNGGMLAQRLCLGSSATTDNNLYKLYVDGGSYFERVRINGLFSVTSKDKVTNLNADRVDDLHAEELLQSLTIENRVLSLTVGGKTLTVTLPASGGLIEVPQN